MCRRQKVDIFLTLLSLSISVSSVEMYSCVYLSLYFSPFADITGRGNFMNNILEIPLFSFDIVSPLVAKMKSGPLNPEEFGETCKQSINGET